MFYVITPSPGSLSYWWHHCPHVSSPNFLLMSFWSQRGRGWWRGWLKTRRKTPFHIPTDTETQTHRLMKHAHIWMHTHIYDLRCTYTFTQIHQRRLNNSLRPDLGGFAVCQFVCVCVCECAVFVCVWELVCMCERVYVLGISLSTLRRRTRREAHVLEAQVNTPALCLLATETER